MNNSNRKVMKLRRLAEADRSRGGKRARYSGTVKALAKELYADGQSISSLEAATGINGNSIRKWWEAGNTAQISNGFRAISVAESTALELILPNGMRVVGLSFAQLLELADHATAA